MTATKLTMRILDEKKQDKFVRLFLCVFKLKIGII